MSPARLLLAALVGVALGVGIAWFTRPAAVSETPPVEPGLDVGDPRPAFRHAAVDGRIRTASEFDGRWLLVNFWATWCAPCVREMPLLQAIDDAYGDRLAVVGIAVDDPVRVPAFVERIGVTYPILVGTSDVRDTQDRYGNPEGLLPYTVLVDADGTVRWRHLGELERPELERALGAAGLLPP